MNFKEAALTSLLLFSASQAQEPFEFKRTQGDLRNLYSIHNDYKNCLRSHDNCEELRSNITHLSSLFNLSFEDSSLYAAVIMQFSKDFDSSYVDCELPLISKNYYRSSHIAIADVKVELLPKLDQIDGIFRIDSSPLNPDSTLQRSREAHSLDSALKSNE